jgi:hypothetical protein
MQDPGGESLRGFVFLELTGEEDCMFDEAMEAADEAAFAILSAAKARVWKSGEETRAREVRAIEMPRDITGDYRAGGRVEEVNFVLECEAQPLLEERVGLGFGSPEVREGWCVLWKKVTYRITSLTWQGATVTLTLGSKADSSGGW